jgi:hypothetical protein
MMLMALTWKISHVRPRGQQRRCGQRAGEALLVFFTAGAESSYREERGFYIFESMTSWTAGHGHGEIPQQRGRAGRWAAR